MSAIVSKLLKRLKAKDKVERCGLVLDGNKIIECANIHDKPEEGFHIPGETMIANKDTMIATWHTHFDKPANLSHEDWDGFLRWPNLRHYIIGIDGVRAFEVEGVLVVEVELA
jgi:proteasome lid subunit RPN8/RPN11